MTKERDRAIAQFTSSVYHKAEAAGVRGNIYSAVVALPPIARRLRKVFERQCNGHQTWDGREDEAATLRDEKREARLIEQAREFATQCGAQLYVQGDPRGWPLYLYWTADLKTGETIDRVYPWLGVGVPV